jgi:hypothetical protein
MIGPSTKPSRFAVKAVWIVVILAGLIAGAVWWGTPRFRPADATARAGDVKRGSDGRLLYFDGRQWTAKPLPPQDTPF